MKRMGLKMENITPKKKSAAGRQNKVRPGAKATTKPKNQRAEVKRRPTQIIDDSELRYRRLFEAADEGLLILDDQTGAMDKIKLSQIAIKKDSQI
jgi:hypothetical protein